MTGTIYKHTNIITNQSYVGQTIKTMQIRLLGHLKIPKIIKKQSQFQKAIITYGIENFKSEVLEENIPLYSIIGEKDNSLDLREIHYIKVHNSFCNGYNANEGGNSQLGFKHSQETIDLLRKKAKEQMKNGISDEIRKKISVNTIKGFTEEGRKIKSETSRANWKKPEYIAKMKNRKTTIKIKKIYNKDGKLMFTSKGSFLKFCELNLLPYKALRLSSNNNGKTLYQTPNAISQAKKKGNEIYEGWYCLDV